MTEFSPELVLDLCVVVALDGWKIGDWLPENQLIRSTAHPSAALAAPSTELIAGAAKNPATLSRFFFRDGIHPAGLAARPAPRPRRFRRLVAEPFDRVFPAGRFAR